MPTENQPITIDSLMKQAQVFASSWSLVGGRFDNGNQLHQADQEKTDLRQMLEQFAKQQGMAAGRKFCGCCGNGCISCRHRAENPPAELPRDNERTLACTLLISEDSFDGAITPERIASWSDAECQAVEEYCMAIHMAASDNEDVEIPARPFVLEARQDLPVGIDSEGGSHD
nr:hypothetical protein [uncultured Pseudomonas sp.]